MDLATSSDQQFEMLVQFSNRLRSEYRLKEEVWRDSPFRWIVTRPSATKGKLAEQFVSGLFAEHGYSVEKSRDRRADRVIAGVRVEIKMSSLWENGTYRFQQVRDQNYALVFCLGISPFSAHCWVIPKIVLMGGRNKLPGLTGQHGGKSGKDTAWLSVSPLSPHAWLREYGGSISDALLAFERLGVQHGGIKRAPRLL